MLKPAAPYDTIEDEAFIEALSLEFQDAAAIERRMIAAGTPVTLATICERMAEFVANTDCIEANGDSWRIVGTIPANANGDPVLHQGCGLELMRSLPNNSIPMVLADMPYGVCRTSIDPKVDVGQWLSEMNRIVTPTGAIVSFGTQPFTTDQINANRDNFKQTLVWIKDTVTGFQLSGGCHLRAHEDILVFSKGTIIGHARSKRQMTYNHQGSTEVEKVMPKVDRRGAFLGNMHSTKPAGTKIKGRDNCPRSVLYYPKDDFKSHSFAKPIALLEYLIKTFSNPGDIVFDPTMGSGSAGVAALNTGRKFIGAENGTDPKGRCIFDIATAKIANGVRGSL